MSARESGTWSYDAIADVYATDMGQSMPFDDIEWYRQLCVRECIGSRRVLELGCGTGRILIPLMQAGMDVIGADRSLPMLARLRRDAAKYNLSPRLLQMDMSLPALRGTFDVILMPYSLITYLRTRTIALAAMKKIATLLAAGGCLVLDAFVPQPVVSFAQFRLDYRRPHGADTLERHKRITVNADNSNRIERSYRTFDRDEHLMDEFSTDETISPRTFQDLIDFGEAAGLCADGLAWDYGTCENPSDARFATVIARKPKQAPTK